MIAAIIAAVWLFGPVLVIGIVIGIGEWHDRRQSRRDERRLATLIQLQDSWSLDGWLPPHERRHG